jgi:hypothetical protein
LEVSLPLSPLRATGAAITEILADVDEPDVTGKH